MSDIVDKWEADARSVLQHRDKVWDLAMHNGTEFKEDKEFTELNRRILALIEQIRKIQK